MDKKLVVGCDNAAFEFKNALVPFLVDLGYEVDDLGVASATDDTPYAEVAERVARIVVASAGGVRGLLFCGTGIGMAIAANKVPGIRAAQVHDTLSAERAALSNDANIITMGGRIIAVELAKKLLLQWLPLRFVPGSSSHKIKAIMDLEKKNGCSGPFIP
ncbi:MAG: RpiB/LacA/LacB family sugar-phosphate isomerase [Planctomycetaceae bacterium]|nr:RpiB/LacA/LacB family sugar-phosphate isomerase [Planctomycetaceae bacterium]